MRPCRVGRDAGQSYPVHGRQNRDRWEAGQHLDDSFGWSKPRSSVRICIQINVLSHGMHRMSQCLAAQVCQSHHTCGDFLRRYKRCRRRNCLVRQLGAKQKGIHWVQTPNTGFNTNGKIGIRLKKGSGIINMNSESGRFFNPLLRCLEQLKKKCSQMML